MLLNVTQLLSSNQSHQTLHTLMTIQHVVILPINLLAALLNGAAFATVVGAASSRSVREIRLGSFAFIDSLCGAFGLTINILFLTGHIGCSSSCELTFNPDVNSGPGVKVTLLRYSMDVLRAAHYCHFLLNAVVNYFYFERPLQFQRFSRHRHFYMVLGCCWFASLAGNLYNLVAGLRFNSDTVYFRFRTYVIPVVHIIHSVVSFGFHYKLACIAFHQIRETSKLADLQARLHPESNTETSRCVQFRKNLRVVSLFLLVFGSFLLTSSPGIYYRAFRPNLPPKLKTVATLLALDVLPSFNFISTFVLLATKNPLIRSGLEDLAKKVSRILCLNFCCGRSKLKKQSEPAVPGLHSDKSPDKQEHVESDRSKTIRNIQTNNNGEETQVTSKPDEVVLSSFLPSPRGGDGERDAA